MSLEERRRQRELDMQKEMEELEKRKKEREEKRRRDKEEVTQIQKCYALHRPWHNILVDASILFIAWPTGERVGG